MSLIKSEPFFVVKWEPPINSGLSPPRPEEGDQRFMTVGWQAKLGPVFYPFDRVIPVKLG